MYTNDWRDAAYRAVTSDRQRLVVDALADCRGGHLSVREIARELNMSRNTVNKAFARLHEAHLLARHGRWTAPGKGACGHLYSLIPPMNNGVNNGMVEPNPPMNNGYEQRDGYAESEGVNNGPTAMRTSGSYSVREGCSSTTEQAEQSEHDLAMRRLASLEAQHGSITGAGRTLIIASLRENAEGVRACYRDAKQRARNPIGLLIRMLQAGEHRTAAAPVCPACGQQHQSVRPRRLELAAQLGYDPDFDCFRCDSCAALAGLTTEVIVHA